MYNKEFEAGTLLGKHISLHKCYKTTMTDHVHLMLKKDNKSANPTKFAFEEEILTSSKYKKYLNLN